LFQRSVFQYNNSGWLPTNRWGATASCDLVFAPLDFFDVALVNRVDLIFAPDASDSVRALLPNYSGGLRFDFRPGIDWLVAFVEADAMYWNYTSELTSVESWMFQAQVGVKLKFNPAGNKGTIERDKAVPQSSDDKNRTNTVIESKKKSIEEIEPGLTTLGRLAPGSEATFTTIVFETGNNTLSAGSMPVLDKIADILNRSKSATISIQAYAEYSGNPVSDLSLMKTRAEKIRSYLAGKGVRDSRIRLAGMGQVIDTNKAKPETPTVVIKILTK
jgi:outer membrane protein OmpA-like peptidoglycan-associated protein